MIYNLICVTRAIETGSLHRDPIETELFELGLYGPTNRVYMNHLALRQLIPMCPNIVNTNSSTLISKRAFEKRSKGVKAFNMQLKFCTSI